MILNLVLVSAESIHKVVTFDGDAGDLDPQLIDEPPDFCFIDGEHSIGAVLSDFEFCFRVVDPDGVICFHDAGLVAPAIARIIRTLDEREIHFVARKPGGATFGIFLGRCRAASDDRVRALARNGRHWLRKHMMYRWCNKHLPDWKLGKVRTVRSRFSW
jgi:hypothetical protein